VHIPIISVPIIYVTNLMQHFSSNFLNEQQNIPSMIMM